MPTIIEIDGLCKTYKGNRQPALDHLTLNVDEGDSFGLLGPNGAGKTTLMNIMCGLSKADSGSISICGLNTASEIDKIKHLIGVVPQSLALYPMLSAVENLRVFGGIYGMERRKLAERSEELLNTFGLWEHRNKRADKYSGGMKRSLNLIVGLLNSPKILFLDEPTVGIDVQTRRAIIDYLKLINNQGTTLIYTSHYLSEAEELCNNVALIDKGRIICNGKPASLTLQHSCSSLEELFLKTTGTAINNA